jgi:hypothetical protein
VSIDEEEATLVRRLLICLSATFLVSFGSSGHAQVTAALSAPDDFVLGNLQFVLLHELAHLVIGEKQIPILGSEEYAADYIAAMLLIRPRATVLVAENTLLRFAVNTADGFVIAWERSAEYASPIPYWGTHALNVQRFSTVACLLYGSNPERFAALPALVEMPLIRAQSCPREYERAAFAVDWLFDTYARKEGDPRGAPVEVRFEPPPSRTSQRLLSLIEERRLIRNTFARLDEFFSLDAPATFVMRACRQPQAEWNPVTRELVICYELLDTYSLMSVARRRGPIESLLSP